MNATDSASIVAQSGHKLERARHLPGDIYYSQEIYQKELEVYFLHDWLFVGREDQYPNPGDYEARRIIGRPILITRNSEGELGAYYNMCQHRGVEIAEGRGNAKYLSCPYHGWTYDMDGRLKGAAFMRETEGFAPANCRLPQIHLKVWRGNIFISFAETPPDFQAQMADFEREFAPLHTERCRVADVSSFTLQCNWKFLHENLMDFYHVGVLHANSFGKRFTWTPENVLLNDDGGIMIRYDAAPSTPEGAALFGKSPWLEQEPNSFARTGFLPPNLTLFARVDMVKLMEAWPIGPDACEVMIYMLFPEEFFADPEFEAKVKVYKDFQHIIYEEDRSMIESMQRAMHLPVYQPGRMSVMEKPIHHFLKGYVNRMFADGR